MTLAYFRVLTANLPDNTLLVIPNEATLIYVPVSATIIEAKVDICGNLLEPHANNWSITTAATVVAISHE